MVKIWPPGHKLSVGLPWQQLHFAHHELLAVLITPVGSTQDLAQLFFVPTFHHSKDDLLQDLDFLSPSDFDQLNPSVTERKTFH